MAPLSGHALPLPVAFQEPLFPFKLMARSFVLPTTLSMRKNADRSAMVLTVCCMRLASAIVAHVPCVPNVKKAFPPGIPRRVSAVFWPFTTNQAMTSAPVEAPPQAPPKMAEPSPCCPVLWGDWPRSQLRRRWMKLMRTELVSLTMGAAPRADQIRVTDEPVITRKHNAHWRLSWNERLARNARLSSAPALQVTIHGLPATFAKAFGFGLLNVA